MNIKVEQVKAIEEALALLPSGAELRNKSKKTRSVIKNAYAVLAELEVARVESNAKNYAKIKERRATDRFYGRGEAFRKKYSTPRKVKTLRYKGETHTIAEWSDILGVPLSTMRSGISRGVKIKHYAENFVGRR
jgi:DNA-directed RNA polymerase specialized sigma24 family protein